MKFIFPVEKNLTVHKIKGNNGLFNILYNGYSKHIPIKIRPDDILNNISSIWAKYVICHAEKFRSLFVDHEGKKTLSYISGGTYSDERMPEFMNGLLDLILKDQKTDRISWALNRQFSTTNFDDKIIRSSAILASQKEYYNYECVLMCGFSEVTLDGTEDDWKNLILFISEMFALDEKVEEWKNNIISVINNMLTGSEDFWQSCVTLKSYGSGSQTEKTGWIKVFNPINEKGEWINCIKDSILDLENIFDVHVNDNGNEFDIKVRSGPISYSFIDDVLSVKNKFHVHKLIKV